MKHIYDWDNHSGKSIITKDNYRITGYSGDYICEWDKFELVDGQWVDANETMTSKVFCELYLSEEMS